MYDHFSDIFKENDDSHIEYNLPHIKSNELDQPFTYDEITSSISKLANKKAAGPDKIPNELLKSLSPEQIILLLDCVNELWENNSVPSNWSDIQIVPIYKKGDASNPGNYRPISLVNTSLKLMTGMMTVRLNNWCDKYEKISDFQGGYRKGRGCQEHVFALRSIIENSLTIKNSKIHACFIDLSSAFDSIVWRKLWPKLAKIGISTKFINMIRAIYSQAKAKIKTQNGESRYFPIQKSVLQGESLSAKLFTIIINDVFEKLNESGITPIRLGLIDVHCLAYADDLIILATNVFDLQLKIDLMSKYFLDNNLIINLNKTKVVTFRNSKKKYVKPKFFWGKGEIEPVKKYKYLGVYFHENVNFRETGMEFTKKAQNAECQLHLIFVQSKLKTLKSRTTLFNSLIKSVLLYCSPIWGLELTEKLEIFQNKFLRNIFQLPPKTPSRFLRLESNTTSIEVNLMKQSLKFFSKIIQFPRNSLLRESFEVSKRNSYKLNSGVKANWYKILGQKLIYWNSQCVLDNIPELYDLDRCCQKKLQINECIRKMYNLSLENDILRMQSSTSMQNYRHLHTHVKHQSFLDINQSWSITRDTVQCRANLSQFTCKTTVKLAALRNFYDESIEATCKNCTYGCTEDIIHVLCECPKYSEARVNFIPNTIDFVSFFSHPNEITMKNTYLFLKVVAESQNC